MTIKTQFERAHFSRWILIGCVALLLSAPRSAAAQQISQVVVFGDSLSDSGNAFALLGTAATAPDFTLNASLIPSAPYAMGGHHFLNGATWVEQLARPLGLAAGVRPAFQGSSAGATNFAVGAARARAVGNFSLPTQVQAFLQQSGGVAPSDALYVIAIGANDVGDALASPQNGAAILGAALNSIVANMTALYAAGARTFLVWNVPNIGLSPAVLMQGPVASLIATQVTQTFNANLAFALGALPFVLPGIQIVPFDAFGLITDIVGNPSVYGMTNVTSACLAPNDPPFVCLNPDEYLFWDGVHPTKAVHAIIAAAVAALLFS